MRLLLLHATVGGLESSLNWLCNPTTRVSSHYVLSKSGVIYQLVAETEAAWHAGTAVWQGEKDVNEISIGVELVNLNTGKDPYPAAQVQALTELTRDLMRRYPGIAFARHMDVALPKGRKTDPAGFPWGQWKASLTPPPAPPTPPAVPVPYTVHGLPVYQRADHTGPLWGHLAVGEKVAIDDISNGHLSDGRGFVDMKGLLAS